MGEANGVTAVSELNDLAAGYVNPETRYTEEGEEDAARLELRWSEASYQLGLKVMAEHHEKQIAAGHMHRCEKCSHPLYDWQAPKHEYRRHGGVKPHDHREDWKTGKLFCITSYFCKQLKEGNAI